MSIPLPAGTKARMLNVDIKNTSLKVTIKVSELKLKLKFIGLLLYTIGILFHVEWCIRMLCSSSITSINVTFIACNHYTDIYLLINI